MHFGGQFQASPSTLDNTPNNYDPSRWSGEPDPDRPTDRIELYWAPQGNGIFDLVDCAVTAVVVDSTSSGPDGLTGKPVSAVYTKAPPKLVDLDPMQQNVSEVWGLMIQIGDPGGAFVRGTFEPVAFNGIRQNAFGPKAPHSSASGSAVYQSTVTNLVWQNPEGRDHSGVLATLRGLAERNVTRKYPDPRLSLRMVVNAHNNAPQQYFFNAETSAAMIAAGVPRDVVRRLQVLCTFVQMADSESSPPGLIPTTSWVNFQLTTLLGEQVANRYGAQIRAATKKPYETVMPTRFNYGLLIGTLGPAGPDEPTYAVPARTLAQVPNSMCYFAPAKLHENALTLDLGNSLPVETPGDPPWADKLGTLTLQCGSQFSQEIDYSGDLFTKNAGVLDIKLDAKTHQVISGKPLSLVGSNGANPLLLQENSEGISLRADQFVFRMNPGEETTESYPRGKTAHVDIHVRKFGRVEGTEGIQIALELLSPAAATTYTLGTLGTSNTKGISDSNISVPQDALQFSTHTATVGAGGVASFQLTATDPGNPRKYVDGQVYFVTYLPTGVPDYIGDPNDLISVQIYHHEEIENPTWDNGIGEILTQFGRLYPVMARFGLSDHESVKKNASMIRRVLELEFSQPLHMPVTRDLSESRRQLILKWMDANMP